MHSKKHQARVALDMSSQTIEFIPPKENKMKLMTFEAAKTAETQHPRRRPMYACVSIKRRREWILDTGASLHMVDETTLTQEELKNVLPKEPPPSIFNHRLKLPSHPVPVK